MPEEPVDPPPSGTIPEKTMRRVAVIGVHGVGHHDPGATANAMADLLLSLTPFNPSKPDPFPKKYFKLFRSSGIQIPLERVFIEPNKRIETQTVGFLHRTTLFLQEESAEFARALTLESAESRKNVHVDLQFTRRLLQDYQGAASGNAYVTTRIEGRRTGDPDRPDADVDIYEMFWADLARPTNTVLSFLLAVFQLVLHLPSLSRLAIDTHATTNLRWKTFQLAQRYASRVLQIVLPLLKVVLLIALFAAAPAVAKAQNLVVVAAALVATATTAAGFLLTDRFHKPAYALRATWLALSFSPGLILGLLTYFSIRFGYWKQEVVLACVIWLVGSLLLWYAITAYQDVRAGIAATGSVCYLIAFAIFWTWFAEGSSIAADSLWMTQWLLVVLRIAWLSLTALAIAAFLLGALVWRSEASDTERAKARAAVRTSRLALALPAFFFVFITGLIWAGLFSIANTTKGKGKEPYFAAGLVHDRVAPGLAGLDKICRFDFFPHRDIGDDFEMCYADCQLHPDYLKGVLAWGIGYGIWAVAVVVATGFIVLVWWALPSVLTERYPLRKRTLWRKGKTDTEPPRSSTNDESVWLGSWISRGLDSMSLVTYLIWLAIFLIPLIFFFTGVWRNDSEVTTKIIVCRAISIAASAALLTSLVHYSSPVLECVLDVDTYLRTSPTEASPRARIFERFASLLRYVAQCRDQSGRRYDSIVIVAHSLGSIISADLLRLLKDLDDDPQLSALGFGPNPLPETIPIQLFTMGNPLRQLLNRFFPYLYSWVRENPDNGMTGLPRPQGKAPGTLSPNALPCPSELGIAAWVNAYRSGDYVGRSLWLDEWYRRTETGDGLYPDPVYFAKDADESPTRIEFCIGSGAHTHYWDDTAPDIALWLNRLL